MRASCDMGGRRRINLPVTKKNTYTTWVKTKKSIGFGKPFDIVVKRHNVKHKVEVDEFECFYCNPEILDTPMCPECKGAVELTTRLIEQGMEMKNANT